MKQFPAILLGGPPHSGKSVLVNILTEALRARHIDHYVLRATPDGEGDWANISDQDLVRMLRRKGKFTPEFVSSTISYLQERHIPLLVDVGGRPTEEQESLFSLCTHAILLAGERDDEPGRFEADMADWQAMMARQRVQVIAALRSVLVGQQSITTPGVATTTPTPTLIGTIAGLERGRTLSGPLLDLLLEQVADILSSSDIDIAGHHQNIAPAGFFVNLKRVLHTMRSGAIRWEPTDLPVLAALIPANKALVVYGRAPNWVYVHLALHAGTAPLSFFNTRAGWMPLPQLPIVGELREHGLQRQPGWAVTQYQQADHTLLDFTSNGQNLDLQQPHLLPLPQPQSTTGLVLSGKMPHWLTAAVAKQLAASRQWIAVYQPPLGGAVIVWSKDPEHLLGHVISVQSDLS